MLSRKYYQQFAGIVRSAVLICEEVDDRPTISFIRDQVVYPLSEVFEQDNPYFDTDKFFVACGFGKEAGYELR